MSANRFRVPGMPACGCEPGMGCGCGGLSGASSSRPTNRGIPGFVGPVESGRVQGSGAAKCIPGTSLEACGFAFARPHGGRPSLGAMKQATSAANGHAAVTPELHSTSTGTGPIVRGRDGPRIEAIRIRPWIGYAERVQDSTDSSLVGKPLNTPSILPIRSVGIPSFSTPIAYSVDTPPQTSNPITGAGGHYGDHEVEGSQCSVEVWSNCVFEGCLTPFWTVFPLFRNLPRGNVRHLFVIVRHCDKTSERFEIRSSSGQQAIALERFGDYLYQTRGTDRSQLMSYDAKWDYRLEFERSYECVVDAQGRTLGAPECRCIGADTMSRYRYRSEYSTRSGPNSNTFVALLLRYCGIWLRDRPGETMRPGHAQYNMHVAASFPGFDDAAHRFFLE